MVQYANIKPQPGYDGSVYSAAVPLTSNEADLFNGAGADPLPVLYGQACSAVVEMSTTGGITAQSSYVVLQTDFGDGVWVDVAWLTYNATTPQTFLLAGGAFQANSFQQRASGTAPSPANGSNQFPLGGRIRFVGRNVSESSSSSSAGPGALPPQVLATIRVKILGLR